MQPHTYFEALKIRLQNATLFYPLDDAKISRNMRPRFYPIKTKASGGDLVTLVKRCPGDGEDRPAHTATQDKFGKCDTRNDGLQPYCRACFAARQRRWKRANVKKVREAKRDYRQRMRAER